MTISNRLQQTLSRIPSVKKSLQRSQDSMEQSTAKKPPMPNAYYDDTVVYLGSDSKPQTSSRGEARASASSTNRKAVIEYIRQQEQRLAQEAQKNQQ